MRNFMSFCEGVNLKTGKEIRFSVPEGISSMGLEALRKNVLVQKEIILPPYSCSHLIQACVPPDVDKIIGLATGSDEDSRIRSVKELKRAVDAATVIDVPGVSAQEKNLLKKPE